MPTDEFNERVANLRDRAETKAQSWSWKDNGAEFAGVFQYWTEGRSEKWGSCPIAVFLDADGAEWSIWCWHKVLANQLIKVNPQAGELVLIRYLGEVEPDGGGPAYANYRAVVDRAAGGGLPIERVARLAGLEDELPAEEERPRVEAPLLDMPSSPVDDDIPF